MGVWGTITALAIIAAPGILALAFRKLRPAIVRRYPLIFITLLIVLPHLLLLLWAIDTAARPGFREAGDPPRTTDMLYWGIGGAALCVVVLVQVVRARLGDCRSGPYLPAILGFGIGGFISVANLDNMALGPDIAVYGAALALGAGFNGVMAVWINAARRDAAPLNVAVPRPVGEPIPPGPLPPRPLD